MSATITSGRSLPAASTSCAPVLDHAHQIELRGEQALERLGDQQMVVGEEHARTARRGHRAPPSLGTQATTVVPWPGALSMSSVPCTSRTRSRMLARPRCSACAGTAPGRSRRRRRRRRGASPSSICRSVTVAARRTGVAGHVVQRLLRHAEQAERHVLADDGGQRTRGPPRGRAGPGDLAVRIPCAAPRPGRAPPGSTGAAGTPGSGCPR